MSSFPDDGLGNNSQCPINTLSEEFSDTFGEKQDNFSSGRCSS
jgi:hypothetical protein